MPTQRNRCVVSLGETCQRCFLRLGKFPDHHCVWSEGRKKCDYCRDVQHHCIPIPQEFQEEAEQAMLEPASELPSFVLIIRLKIVRRTRRINRERASEVAATTPATETESESEDEDNDTDFALEEHNCSSDEVYENSEMDAASEDQLQSSLTSTAEHEESEIDRAAEEQLQSSLAKEALELEVKKVTVSWHSQSPLDCWKRWERTKWQTK